MSERGWALPFLHQHPPSLPSTCLYSRSSDIKKIEIKQSESSWNVLGISVLHWRKWRKITNGGVVGGDVYQDCSAVGGLQMVLGTDSSVYVCVFWGLAFPH